MPLVLSPTTVDDLPGICDVHYHAFTDPFSLTLHPRTTYSQHVEAYGNHLRRALEVPSQSIYKVADTADGKIISFAKWSVACLNDEKAKEKAEKAEKKNDEREVNNGPAKEKALAQSKENGTATPQPTKAVNMDFGNAFKKKIEAIQSKHVGDRKTLFLEVLCTLPEYRGKGAAKMHLRWGEEYACKKGIPIWLDASPVGLGLYQKEGFTFVENVETNLEEWGGEGVCVHTCMVKDYGEGRDKGVEM